MATKSAMYTCKFNAVVDIVFFFVVAIMASLVLK